ncbi:MAG: oligogalacturonate lyase family protein [Opitutaceae bacterium]|jgi:oligogalacturonide lyase|nr:oligogalacturonate lyase family protein [Opitutaceae bacterium]
MRTALIPALFIITLTGLARAAEEPPVEWIDPDTGHRVVRLSSEPRTSSLYFHQNAYSRDGSRIIATTSDGGIATINIATREIKKIVPGRVMVLVTGRKTGDVYYTRRAERGAEATVYAANLDTGVERKITTIPGNVNLGSLNCDETLLLGTRIPGPPAPRPPPNASGRPDLRANLAIARSGPPRELVTISTATGDIKVVHTEREWTNHIQFSPTDPNQILFCHEGPWHEVDRLWTVRADGTGLTKIHTRTMTMEIAGHEFFSGDGKTIWYDLQTPRGEDFWVAGYEIATGKRTWYHMERDNWSVHFNVSPDGKLFAGDGFDEKGVSRATNGHWIWLFRPELVPDRAVDKSALADNLITPGVFKAERLVNMSKHNYRLEPNLTFSPDMKWIIFRSNMHGATQVYAVEIAKSETAK